jgi:hypothetical protein
MKRLWIVIASAGMALGQTPPCGVAVLRTGGEKVETRFLPAPPEHVRGAAIRALPSLGMRLQKDQERVIEGKSDLDFYKAISRQNRDAGVKGKVRSGLGAFGTAKIFLEPQTQEGVKGTLMRVEFHKNKMKGRLGSDRYAGPLADEIACLAKVQSQTDPAAAPRGLAPPERREVAEVTVPAGTKVKLLLRQGLFSKDLNNQKKRPARIDYEVAEDVAVNGVVAIRKGALATAIPGKGKKAGSYGGHANLEFRFDSVTSVDGQTIQLTEQEERVKGGRHDDTGVTLLSGGVLLGAFMKGNEAIVRAGVGYEVETAGDVVVKGWR